MRVIIIIIIVIIHHHHQHHHVPVHAYVPAPTYGRRESREDEIWMTAEGVGRREEKAERREEEGVERRREEG